MNDLEQHFKKAAEQIRMTSDEKSAMRFRVEQQMAPSAPAPVSSNTPSPYVWMFAPRSLAMLSVALLVILSTGSAYASGDSLPGTPLYPVKTKIVEPLKVALASTVEAKAQANADIAATRVQEAQTLAAKGTLTPEAVKQISDNYNEHAKAALALVADIDAREGGYDDQDSNDSQEPDTTVVTVAVAVDDQAPEPAVMATMMAEPVEPDADDSDSNDDVNDDVVAVAPIAPVAFSLSIQATSSKNKADEETSSASNARTQRVMKVAPPVAVKATSTATTTVTQGTSRDFVRTLRASLSAQAEILERINADVRLEKGDD